MKVKLEKRQIIFLVCLIIIFSIIAIIVMEMKVNERVQRVRLDNGDEITFNEHSSVIYRKPSQTFDKRFTLIPAKKAEGRFESLAAVALPDDVQNVRHFFQVRSDDADRIERKETGSGEYDEIWQWETAIYCDAKDAVIQLERNGGSRYGISNQGYMELSFYREKPQRADLEYPYEELTFIRSSVQGKYCFVSEFTSYLYCDERARYEAEFVDVDGQGTGALLIADNVSREYFTGLLEWVVGSTYPSADERAAEEEEKSGKMDFINGQKEIACRTAAEKIVYETLFSELDGKLEEFTIDTWYFADEKDYNGKKYNIYCESWVRDYGAPMWYMMMEEEEGRYRETGSSLRIDDE